MPAGCRRSQGEPNGGGGGPSKVGGALRAAMVLGLGSRLPRWFWGGGVQLRDGYFLVQAEVMRGFQPRGRER